MPLLRPIFEMSTIKRFGEWIGSVCGISITQSSSDWLVNKKNIEVVDPSEIICYYFCLEGFMEEEGT